MESRIFMLTQAAWHPGRCSVCGRRAILRYRDSTTGWFLCNHCLGEVLAAERELLSVTVQCGQGNRLGIRHPNIKESDSFRTRKR